MEPLKPGCRVLVADFRADFGFFRKPYTNMSPRTFPIPPGTTIRGMLAAIRGVDRELAPEFYADARLALRLCDPVRRRNLGINYLKTTSSSHFARFKEHKPTNQELLVEPHFRFFVHLPDPDEHEALRDLLVHHRSVYTLSFGNSESLANYRWIGDAEVVESASGSAELASIAPTETVSDMDYRHRELFTTTLPDVMNNQRVVQRFTEFIFDRNGRTLQGRFSQFNRLSTGESVVFF